MDIDCVIPTIINYLMEQVEQLFIIYRTDKN